ncbi:MAG: oligosaccharide flippase family protein, partial [Anaerolineales bacterium]|nr:oligosaccharide flippase family protein [Anaerolineales bacterium]
RYFFLNSFSSVVLLVAKSIVGIWFTKFLIDNLSLAIYGLVPLAVAMTNYMSVVMTALNYAVGRYFTIDLRSGNLHTAVRTFNTALWGTILAVLFLAPFAFGFSYASPRIFDVPLGFELDAQMLFGLVMGAYLLSIVRSIFSLSSFATNRLDLQNWGLLLDLAVRIGIPILLFQLFAPSLWQVGLGAFVGAVLSFGLAVWVWRWLTPAVVIDLRAFEAKRLRPLMSTGGWIVLSQAGNLLLLNVDLIIVNLILGAEAGGQYGSVLQWSLLLRTIAIAMSAVLKPTALDLYARGQMVQLHQMVTQAVKLFGLFLALPVGGLMVYAAPLLTVWLGDSFASLSWLLACLVVHLAVNMSVLSLFHLQVTLNKVRWMGIGTAVAGVANVILGVWWTNWLGMIGLALAGLVVFSVRNAILTPIYSAYIMQRPWYIYLKPLSSIVIATGLATILAMLSALFVMPNSWITLILNGTVVAIVYTIIVYIFMLNRVDRDLIMQFNPFAHMYTKVKHTS